MIFISNRRITFLGEINLYMIKLQAARFYHAACKKLMICDNL